MNTRRERGPAWWRRVDAVLDAVLDLPESERVAVLDERCGTDAELRAEVDALLAAEARADSRVDSPVFAWADAILEDQEDGIPVHAPAEQIGPYRLVRELGRGGMGVVWLAERREGDFDQHVALKLLKRGLDTDAILARFLDERRILARLRHPHIAALLDGGVSESGQPWFSMEWVDGETITRWCDARKLGIRERVRLFGDVIEAVQHAHQQLIVHRDLKPGNVMVDGNGEVKLLDFGIAKMLDVTRQSAEAATLTQMGWRVFTPEYAAPEQLRGEPATTTADVYALGVLLHELLAGQRPEPAQRDAALPQQRPSAAITESAAALRGTGSDRLKRLLQGDLDTIVQKALQFEPGRRYGSAQALGDDLQRWLDGQPVQARPDSVWYRSRRFIGRHRWPLLAAASVVLSLTAGLLVAVWQAGEAHRQALLAERQTVEARKQTQRAERTQSLLVSIVSRSSPYGSRDGRQPMVDDILAFGEGRIDQELASEPELHADMLTVFSSIRESRRELDRAETLARRALAERRHLFGTAHQAYAESLFQLSSVLYAQGDWDGSEQAVTEAAAIFERTLGEHPLTAKAYEGMAYPLAMGKDPAKAVRLQRRALAIYRKALGERSEDTARVERELGPVLMQQGRMAEGEALLKHALETTAWLSGTGSLRHAHALNAYAQGLDTAGNIRRSAELYLQAATIYRTFDDAPPAGDRAWEPRARAAAAGTVRTGRAEFEGGVGALEDGGHGRDAPGGLPVA